MRYPLIVLCSLVFIIHSCHPVDRQPCGDVKCVKVGLKLQLNGYADSAYETMYLHTYNAGSSFADPVSTRTLHADDAPINGISGNGNRLLSGVLMDAGHDYELILASTHDTLRVWDVQAPADTVKIECGTKGCYAFVRSCQTNKESGKWNIASATASQDMSVVFYK